MPRARKVQEAETVVEAAVEKVEKAVKAAKPKKTVKTEEVILQFAGNECSINSLTDQAKQAYVAAGHRTTSIKDLKVYVKPEEGKAYYVINDDVTGELNLY